jgi:hypothetical protein
VGGACGTHGRGDECVQGCDGKARRKEINRRPRRRWDDGIRMDLREIGWGSLDWIQLAQDRDRYCEYCDEPSGSGATELVIYVWFLGDFLPRVSTTLRSLSTLRAICSSHLIFFSFVTLMTINYVVFSILLLP